MIEQTFNIIYQAIATTNDTPQTCVMELLRDLCAELMENEQDEFVWSIGEFSEFTLDSLIIGAYWYFTDYHNGQSSYEYVTLCALGCVYNPNMDSLEEDSPEQAVYNLLEEFYK